MKNTALITGASSGIGLELAHIHANKGGDLIIVARSEDKLQALKNELESAHKIKVEIAVKDLSQANAGEELYNDIKERGLEVDILINNAGFGGIGNFHEREWKSDLEMMNLNMIALTTLTRLFLNDFTAKNQGKILNVSSTASLMPGPRQAVYYATKAFVTSFSNAIAEELKESNITVTNLMPGATETGFGSVSGMDKTVLFDKTASPKKVALDGYEGMMKGKLDVISGLTCSQKIMMSMMKFMPKSILLKTINKMQEEK